MPEDEVMKMAKGKKEPMEIKRCVEFFQMVHSAEMKKGRRYKNDYDRDCDLTFWAVQFNEIVCKNSQGLS